MTQQPDAVRAALQAQRAELLALLGRLDESFAAIVEGSRDTNIDDEHDPEGATVALERQLVSSRADDARLRLEQIDRALARVNAGSYGRCEGCGEPIAPERLEVLPAASHCVRCAARKR